MSHFAKLRIPNFWENIRDYFNNTRLKLTPIQSSTYKFLSVESYVLFADLWFRQSLVTYLT